MHLFYIHPGLKQEYKDADVVPAIILIKPYCEIAKPRTLYSTSVIGRAWASIESPTYPMQVSLMFSLHHI